MSSDTAFGAPAPTHTIIARGDVRIEVLAQGSGPLIVLLPSLGATTLIALVVAGQMAAAITLDHFGAFGLVQHPISISRLVGAALLIAGVILIKD